jgi:hypothetical protein
MPYIEEARVRTEPAADALRRGDADITSSMGL